MGTNNGYQHIKEVATARTSEAFWVKWQVGGVALTLHINGAPGTEVIRGIAPGRNPADKVPVILLRRQGRSTVFEVRHEVN